MVVSFRMIEKTNEPAMTDEAEIPAQAEPLSARAVARAAARARRARSVERRELCFNFFVSGFSPHDIAKALKASPATVRRLIDQAIRERRLDAPEAYVHVQVARLGKALSLIDARIDQGETDAVAPLLKLVAALDRYHGLDARYQRLAPKIPPDEEPRLEGPPASPLPLALTHQAALPEPEGDALVEDIYVIDRY